MPSRSDRTRTSKNIVSSSPFFPQSRYDRTPAMEVVRQEALSQQFRTPQLFPAIVRAPFALKEAPFEFPQKKLTIPEEDETQYHKKHFTEKALKS